MKRLLLVALLLGCGRKEFVRTEQTEQDDFFSEVKSDTVVAVHKPLMVEPVDAPDDSTREIVWPDNKPLKFRHWVANRDTHGNPIEIALAVELQQIVVDSVFETFALTERVNYIISGDTLIVAVDKLRGLNIKAAEEYTYLWRFRYRAENNGAFEKFSDWSYSNNIRLMDASKLWGIPKKPKRLQIIR